MVLSFCHRLLFRQECILEEYPMTVYVIYKLHLLAARYLLDSSDTN